MKNFKKLFKKFITLTLNFISLTSICAYTNKNTKSLNKDYLSQITENKKSKIVDFDIELVKEIADRIIFINDRNII